MTALKLHPACACYDPMPEAELDELARDIKQNGLLEPITVMPDRETILDGRNRWLGCERAGVEPRIVVYAGSDPIRFVMSKNERRRHSSLLRRAEIAAELANLETGSNQYQKKVGLSCERPITVSEAARALNVGESSVYDAAILREEASPNVRGMVERREVGLRAAAGAVRGVQKADQQDWTAAEVKRIGQSRRNGAPAPGVRTKGTAAPKRLNAFTARRPGFRHLSGEESGMPATVLLGQQAPGKPNGVTVALADVQANGHIRLHPPREAEQIELRRRFQELTIRLLRLAAEEDLPQPGDLARLDPAEAQRIRQQLRKCLAPVQHRLAAFAAAVEA